MILTRGRSNLMWSCGGFTTAVFLGVFGWGCSDAPSASCVPGETVSCACPGGLDGTRVCSPNRIFLDCDCGTDAGQPDVKPDTGVPPDSGAPDAGPPTQRVHNVSGGPFIRGCDEAYDPECGPSEPPRTTETISSFGVDEFEVTVADYEACVLDGACSSANLTSSEGCNWAIEGHGSHPINCVTWSEAKTYCQWAGKRLLRDVEWEKAARGPDGRRYPWGDEPATCDLTNSSTCSGSTLMVGSHPLGASPYGAHDMAGNVAEWVMDSDAQGQTRRVRGGGFADPPVEHRTTYGVYRSPDERSPSLGFRCGDDFADRRLLAQMFIKASVCADESITARTYGDFVVGYSGGLGGMLLPLRHWLACAEGVSACDQDLVNCELAFSGSCFGLPGRCSGTLLECPHPDFPDTVHDCGDRIDGNVMCAMVNGVASCVAGPCDREGGRCEGDVAVECRDGALIKTPCADFAATCVATAEGATCVHEALSCQRDTVGCVGGNTVTRCVGAGSDGPGVGVLLQDCRAAVPGGACVPQPNNRFACAVPEAKAECDEEAVRCQGAVARVCTRGAWLEFDCASFENRRCRVTSTTEVRCIPR